MDPRDAFAAFRASCWQKVRVIQDFIARRESFHLTYGEAWELEEMRDILTDQFACMEETWDNLLKSVNVYSIDTDRDAVFGEFAGIMKSTRRVMDMALKLLG